MRENNQKENDNEPKELVIRPFENLGWNVKFDHPNPETEHKPNEKE